MKVVHWTFSNGSGLNRVSTMMALTERALGLDSFVCFTDNPQQVDPNIPLIDAMGAMEADVHVIHSHAPEQVKGKRVFFAHGTPEHCFTIAIEQAKITPLGAAGDPFMLSLYRLQRSDLTLTFWPRHQKIWQSMAPNGNVQVVPMGIDTEFWKKQSVTKLGGNPALLTCENAHQIKWPLDLFLAYPFIMEQIPDVFLHAHYLPADQHRYWYPLLYANGTAFRSHTSGGYFAPVELRNLFSASDFYINLVKYGDFNTITLEAKSTGVPVISYEGNEYADFWITEGGNIAKQFIDIFTGKAQVRVATPVPSHVDMSKRMIEHYENITKH